MRLGDLKRSDFESEFDGTEISFYEANGVTVKQIAPKGVGAIVFQHVHDYDHLTLLASGSAEIWKNGEMTIEKAPKPIEIEAGVAHKFVTLEENTVFYCIHNTDRYTYTEQ